MSGSTGDEENLPTDGLARWGPFFGADTCQTDDGVECRVVLAVGGTASNLYVATEGAPGTGSSWTFTVLQNGVATALTTTISGTATSNSNLVNTVTFVAGDTISIHIKGAGTPTASQSGSWSIQYS